MKWKKKKQKSLIQATMESGKAEPYRDSVGVKRMQMNAHRYKAICKRKRMDVLSDLKSKAVMISTPEEITQVVTISTNGEREIGELIARAMEKVGKEGIITIADENTLDDELEVVEGMKLACGYISPYFVTNEKTRKCTGTGKSLDPNSRQENFGINSLVRVLEMAVKRRSPLLIVVEDVESETLTMLIINKHRAGLKLRTTMEKSTALFDKEKAQERLSKFSYTERIE